MRAGTAGLSVTAIVPVAIFSTGARSLMTSYGTFRYRLTVITSVFAVISKGVPVRRRLHDHVGADVAARARAVVDDDRLPPSFRQLLPHRARKDVHAGPGVNGTMICTGRFGYGWTLFDGACADALHASNPTAGKRHDPRPSISARSLMAFSYPPLSVSRWYPAMRL